jgi:hypothetical protein
MEGYKFKSTQRMKEQLRNREVENAAELVETPDLVISKVGIYKASPPLHY